MTAPEVLVGPDEIRATVRRLGAEVAADHPDGVVLVGVLKGALLFTADLARAIDDPRLEVEFMEISRFAPDSGRVRILHDITVDIAGRDIVVVEDIVDTGLTLTYLLGQLALRNPRSLHACTFLDRPRRRIVPLDVRYRGIVLDDEYVLGYGLHFRDLYRNLPYVIRAERDVLRERPDAYVAGAYGAFAPVGTGDPGGKVASTERRTP
ncbi:MAG TPA: phosphoribosyltransferase family protein [Acidimicrobiia bacterium]|nr:phosphoribosyltransferase family protein [Acidimicrobiia bacterium]